jgi:hypothetical protein
MIEERIVDAFEPQEQAEDDEHGEHRVPRG